MRGLIHQGAAGDEAAELVRRHLAGGERQVVEREAARAERGEARAQAGGVDTARARQERRGVVARTGHVRAVAVAEGDAGLVADAYELGVARCAEGVAREVEEQVTVLPAVVDHEAVGDGCRDPGRVAVLGQQ